MTAAERIGEADGLDIEQWLEAIIAMARHYRLELSEESLRLNARWQHDEAPRATLQRLARQAGLGLRFCDWPERLPASRLPMVVALDDGQVAVVEALAGDDQVNLRLLAEGGLSNTWPLARLRAHLVCAALLRPLSGRRDARVDGYLAAYQPHWLRHIVLRDLRPYAYVMLASLAINSLGLAGVLFSMQVYDRVIPAQSLPTLYVLFCGVLLATLFAFGMRMLSGLVTDILGKRADQRVSDRVFGHALRLRNSARPRSTGAFIAQLRELEQIRELITSSTLLALADLPFFLLFLLVFWLIAAPLAWLPVLALALMLLPSLLAQGALARRAQVSMREASLRNALLVESIQGLEDIKGLQAEPRIQQQWNQYNSATAEASMSLRKLVNGLSAWSQAMQNLVFALVVLVGAPLVMDGEMTTGALVAASILASRMLVPMGQLTQVLNRWQQARVAMDSLDRIMRLPLDRAEGGKYLQRAALQGDYRLQGAAFSHVADAGQPVLSIERLEIRAGERIAVLGRNGAGKSTLLQALAGGVERTAGILSLDGVNLEQLDPADVRRDVGLLTQNARLFHGTLRDNLLLGAPRARDEELLEALAACGAADFLQRLPLGLDYPIAEGGLGLSGGQRQSLLLARLLLRQPNVLLLDEPTAALDEMTERQFIERLDRWLGRRTLVLATHRMAALQLVERVLVVEGGRLILDAPKEQAIAALSRGRAGQGG